jgi:hypothetical protein
MRQWGRHATAFLGRRHFNDPDLIEQRFSVVEPWRDAASTRRSTASLVSRY